MAKKSEPKQDPKSEHDARVREELGKLKRKATRMEAVTTLGSWQAAEAIEPLLDLCKRAKREERAIICQALAQIGAGETPGSTVSILIDEGLGSKHVRVRRCAICALAAMGPAARPAFEPLLKCLQDAEGTSADASHVRIEAIGALGAIGDPRAVEPLVALLADPDRDVCERAADALGQLGEAAVDAVLLAFERPEDSLKKRDIRTCSTAARALGQIGGAAAEAALCQAFQDPDAPREIRVAALSALEGALGADIVPLAAAALEDREIEIRRQAVRCLCTVDSVASTAHLMTLYADEDKKVRTAVVQELQARSAQLLELIRAGEMEALSPLLAAWRAMDEDREDEADAISRELAEVGQLLVPALCAQLDVAAPCADVIGVLERMGPAAGDAFEALVVQLDNPDSATCCAAARALGAIGDERAIPALVNCLSYDDSGWDGKKSKAKKARKRALALQQAAAEGLGRLGRPAMLRAIEAAGCGDPIARRGGVMALGYIGGGRALGVLDRAVSDPDPAVREAAATAMERAAAGDITRMGKLLENKDDRVRAKAVRALGELDDLRSLDLLLRAYGDPSPRVNKAVVRALAEREGERAHSVLIASAAGGNITALRALRKHPTPQAIPALIEALDSPWSEVYDAALQTLRGYVDVYAEGAGETEDPDSPWVELRRAIPELTYLLHDDSARTRRLALETLGAFRDPGTVQDVAYLLMDDKEDIRFSAVHILESIDDEGAIAVLRAYLERGDRYEGTADEDLYAEISEVLSRLAAHPG
jgi:HEAT repeat protein